MSSKTVIKHLNNLFMIFGMPSYIHSDRGTSFLSNEVKEYLHSRGIATSKTTAYNPQGNGQVEKLNSTLWKAIQLGLRSHNLPIESWEKVLDNALHSIRSLLCTSINCTPHERMFKHSRKSPNGGTIPTWLSSAGQVLVKRCARANKYLPLVEEADVVEVNPGYSIVRLSDGRETAVSNRHLAPIGEGGEIIQEQEVTPASDTYLETPNCRQSETEPVEPLTNPVRFETPEHEPNPPSSTDISTPPREPDSPLVWGTPDGPSHSGSPEPRQEVPLRRSCRTRRPPQYLQDFTF